jgi:hypothetical protein
MALTEILARLQQKFGDQQDWEVKATSFLNEIEGGNWSKIDLSQSRRIGYIADCEQ